MFSSPFPFPAGGQDFMGFEHAGSAMFNRQSSGNYLRWPSPGTHGSNAPNMDVATVSLWFRLGEIANLAIRRTLITGFFNVQNFTALELNASGQLDFFVFGGNAFLSRLVTERILRDPTAWYHVVVQWDSNNATADARHRMWLNGKEITTFATRQNPSLGRDVNWVTSGWATAIGGQGVIARTHEGFIADVYHINDALVDPSVFGRFHPVHGEWIPKEPQGLTFNSASFHVDFADENNLGKDQSGNNNDFVSLGTFGSANSFLDVPAKTYPIGNSVQASNGMDFSEACLTGNELTNGQANAALTTHVLPVGKWVWEVKLNFVGPQNHGISVAPEHTKNSQGQGGNHNMIYSVTGGGVTDLTGATAQNIGASATNDVLTFAVDIKESGEIDFWIARNGVWQGTGSPDPATGADPIVRQTPAYPFPARPNVVPVAFSAFQGSWSLNFGQRRGGLTYAIPAGFKEVNTENFPIPKGPALQPSKYFGIIGYEGDGASSRTLTGLDFQPDMVWLKNLDTTNGWRVAINMAGFSPSPSTPNNLATSETAAASNFTAGNIVGFNSDGFDVEDGSSSGNAVNQSGQTHMAWCWKSDPAAGFEIIRFVGDGVAGRTVAHNLGVAPELILVKTLEVTSSWHMYGRTYGRVGSPEDFFLTLNTTNAASNDNTVWNDTAPTATEFTLGTNAAVNGNGREFVALVFASVPGFMKIPSMEGNGNANGQIIPLDFAPITFYNKNWDSVQHHLLAARNMNPASTGGDGENQDDRAIEVNQNTSLTLAGAHDELANGWKQRGTDGRWNRNNDHHCGFIYAEVASKFARAR